LIAKDGKNRGRRSRQAKMKLTGGLGPSDNS
jgi:hypothetical protein